MWKIAFEVALLAVRTWHTSASCGTDLRYVLYYKFFHQNSRYDRGQSAHYCGRNCPALNYPNEVGCFMFRENSKDVTKNAFSPIMRLVEKRHPRKRKICNNHLVEIKEFAFQFILFNLFDADILLLYLLYLNYLQL